MVASLAYLARSVLAYWMRHPRRGAIVALNIVAGWTVLGWIVALAWAMRRSDAPVHASTLRG